MKSFNLPLQGVQFTIFHTKLLEKFHHPSNIHTWSLVSALFSHWIIVLLQETCSNPCFLWSQQKYWLQEQEKKLHKTYTNYVILPMVLRHFQFKSSTVMQSNALYSALKMTRESSLRCNAKMMQWMQRNDAMNAKEWCSDCKKPVQWEETWAATFK